MLTNPTRSHRGYFITGTDTEVGKTTIAVQLLKHYQAQGLSTVALKPIASGCEQTAEGLRNGDALQLMQAATLDLQYEHVNPFAYLPPISPHLAANANGEVLTVSKIMKACKPGLNRQAEITLVEGAGGWQVPLNDNETMADFAKTLGFPVIIVVGLRLGCLNHALLTRQSVLETGLPIAGWVANGVDPNMLYLDENIATLKQYYSEPLLGYIPHQSHEPSAFFEQ